MKNEHSAQCDHANRQDDLTEPEFADQPDQPLVLALEELDATGVNIRFRPAFAQFGRDHAVL